ncbi:MAG: GNAT family N-acetyltransferase [Pseudomonadota bacterium]
MKIEIKFVNSWPTKEIIDLYKAGAWWYEENNAKRLPRMIENSFAFAVAVDKETKKAIGMGRVISDGVSDAYIQDVVVMKEYRSQGIGKEILTNLINFCKAHKMEWIGLIADGDSYKLYEKLGFQEMKNHKAMLLSSSN